VDTIYETSFRFSDSIIGFGSRRNKQSQLSAFKSDFKCKYVQTKTKTKGLIYSQANGFYIHAEYMHADNRLLLTILRNFGVAFFGLTLILFHESPAVMKSMLGCPFYAHLMAQRYKPAPCDTTKCKLQEASELIPHYRHDKLN
jgi:hypothetical protein